MIINDNSEKKMKTDLMKSEMDILFKVLFQYLIHIISYIDIKK